MQEANHLLATVDELSAKQLGDALTAYGVKSPDTKNDISTPFPFNLMFKTSIGPKGDQVGYLRPETAQGLFVNFRWGHQSIHKFVAVLLMPVLLYGGLSLGSVGCGAWLCRQADMLALYSCIT